MAQQRSPSLAPGPPSAPIRGRALRRAPVVLVLVALFLAWAGPAAAMSTERFTATRDDSRVFTCPDGHQAELRVVGTNSVTLFRDASGTLVREVDRIRNRWGVHATETGKGWSTWWATDFRFDFDAGADVGDPVTVTVVGSFFQNIPGVGTDSGIRVYAGTIVGYDEGFPEVDFDLDGPTIFSAGHHPALDWCATTS